jgi:hypothetical protein
MTPIEDVLIAVREDLQSDRADTMAKNLKLTSDEAAKFWPVFSAYQKRQNVIMDEQLKGIQRYIESFDTLDDAGALELINAHLARDAKMVSLRQKWLGEFQKVLGTKIAARAIQIDRRLSLAAADALEPPRFRSCTERPRPRALHGAWRACYDFARVAEFLSLRDAVARYVKPGARVALEGFTHLIPFAAGHEIIRQRLTDLTLIRMTPDSRLRPDDRLRLRGEAGVLVGRQSRRRLAAPAARRGRARLAASPGDRGTQPRGDGARLCRGGRRHALRDLPRLSRLGSASRQSEHQDRCLPVQRDTLAAVPALRMDVTIVTRRGGPRRQRLHRRHRRGAEGSGAGGAARHRHGRGDRGRSRDGGDQRGRAARLERRRDRARARAARGRPTRTATTRGTTRSTPRGTPSPATATRSGRWIDANVMTAPSGVTACAP